MLNKTLLFHQSLGPSSLLSLSVSLSVSLPLSLSLSLSQANSLEHRSPLSSLSCPGFQDPRERAPCAYGKRCKPCVKGFIGFLCKPGNISHFLSLPLSYCRLQTTRFWSIKGPQQEPIYEAASFSCMSNEGHYFPYPFAPQPHHFNI